MDLLERTSAPPARTSASHGRVLLIDDESAVVSALSALLWNAGFEVDSATRSSEVSAAIERFAPEAVVLDYVMPDIDGLTMLTALRERDPTLTVVMLSGIMDVPLTVRALRAGAADVLAKPAETELLMAALHRGLAQTRLLRTHRTARHRPVDPFGVIDDSPVMQRVVRIAEQAAAGSMPVMLIGEVGTGKRAMAQLVHQKSSRAGKAFAMLACGAGERARVERALLGSGIAAARAAREFSPPLDTSTNTDDETAGLLRLSAGGTLVLDEPVTLSPAVQDALALLTASPHNRSVGPRLVITSRRDLADEVRSGALRSDLYQHLSAMPLVLPPLRVRGDGAVRQLAERMLTAQRAEVNEGPRRLTAGALADLCAASWPGNVRQLRAVVDEAFALALDDDTIDSPHVRAVFTRRGLSEAHATPDDYTLRTHERAHIARVLSLTSGQRTEAARLLGITRTTLYKKIDDYGLESGAGRPAR